MFKEWELPNNGRGFWLTTCQVSIIYNEDRKSRYGFTLCFSGERTREFINKGYNKVCILQDDITGEIGLLIGREKGLNLKMCGNDKGYKNARLDSKVWVGKLCDIFEIPKDGIRRVLQLSDNLSKNEDSMFFRIIKKV